MTQQETHFNPNDYLMQIKSGKEMKDYLPVQIGRASCRERV